MKASKFLLLVILFLSSLYVVYIRPVIYTDGKIYIAHMEHSSIDPKPRGAPFICLDMETGDEIWRADGLFRGTLWGGIGIIGDSIIATMDTYDQRVYAIGKGPSATTVTASPEVSVHGSSVLVKGMVTDISPGTEDYALTARFPNGVPAVADESMSDWMLYVYKQFPRPADATGVEVVLEAVDPNGNFYEIGRVTSDMSGMFKKMWTPEIEGKYTIIATFEGSESYWSSYAETAIGVGPAPETYPETPAYPEGITAEEVAEKVLDNLPEALSAEDVAQEIINQLAEEPEEPEAPFITTEQIIIAVVVVAIVVGIVSFYVLRRRRRIK